jgi:hypothetical protein
VVLPLVGIIKCRPTGGPQSIVLASKVKSPVRLDMLLAEVAVVLVDPVLAGWSKDVEVNGVFEGGGGVRQVGRNDEDLAGVDDVRGAVVEIEAECAFGDEGDLLVGVGVAGDDASLAEHDAGKHGLVAGDELTSEERVELFGFDFAPAMKGCGGHREEPF